MPTRGGISTDPERRLREHALTHVGITNVRFYGPFRTKAEAQNWENRLPDWVVRHPGGGDSNKPWVGYLFDYSRRKLSNK